MVLAYAEALLLLGADHVLHEIAEQVLATGDFARQYIAAAAELESKAVANRAIVQAQPHAPGIVTASEHEVTLLLFVDQVSVRQPSGTATPLTRASQSRVEMTLSLVDGTWRLAALSACWICPVVAVEVSQP